MRGILLAGAVSLVRKAIREGDLLREHVEARLEGPDHAFLDEKVDPAEWYPVVTLGHYLDVLADLAGGDRREALMALGRDAADMTAHSGEYGQLARDRTVSERPSEVLRYGRLVTTVITHFYDFSRMSFGPHPAEPEAFQIDWYDVGDLPESNRLCAEGFIDRVAEYASAMPLAVASDRPSPDHIEVTIRQA